MICNSCKLVFDNSNNNLKFCPYCGVKIAEPKVNEVFQNTETLAEHETRLIDEEPPVKKKIHDTLEMPAVTEVDIKNYKREKFLSNFKSKFLRMKVLLPVLTVLLVIGVGVIGYMFFTTKPVDEGRIREDLIGKAITLPKGTSIEIKKAHIKSFSINARNTSKNEGKDDIKASVTLNNGSLEVKTLLAVQYIYQGKNQWKISDQLAIAGDTVVKPAAVMEEKQLLDGLKAQSITIGDASKALGGEDVKKLSILSRTPELENLKEEVLVDVGIDSGIVAATGKIKCRLNFENEVWNLAGIEKSSPEDFKLELSPAFSQDRIIEVIKKDVIEETVTHPNVFGGKGFYVKDSFTKSISIADKKFDEQKGTLTVTAKRENSAGEIKTTLTNDYTFNVSFTKLELTKKTKVAVENVSVGDMSRDFIVSTIANVEIEGGNLFFWKSDNHKITFDEAKTFKSEKMLSRKGYQNVRYVYGSINYTENKKEKNTSFVALYYLVYDTSKGYTWKLDKIIGEESPNYKSYYPEPK